MKIVEEDTIDLLELARALWKNILAIALAAVLAGSAAFAYTAFMIAPQYTATTSLYVNSSSFRLGATSYSISASEMTTSNSLVSVYLYILKSRTTMEEVIQTVCPIHRNSSAAWFRPEGSAVRPLWKSRSPAPIPPRQS